MNKIEIYSSVINGKLKRNRNLILKAISSFDGKNIKITISRQRKIRSNSQNAYYWSVIIPLFIEAVYDTWGEVWSKDKAHNTLKSKFLFTERINEDTGEVIKIDKSTTECSTTEMEEYFTDCRNFLLEWFNVDCPLPNEEITLNFK